MRVPSLGGEDHLEEEMAPTPVFLPRKFHRRRRSVGYSLWGLKATECVCAADSFNLSKSRKTVQNSTMKRKCRWGFDVVTECMLGPPYGEEKGGKRKSEVRGEGGEGSCG